jgi:hypothetical protein
VPHSCPKRPESASWSGAGFDASNPRNPWRKAASGGDRRRRSFPPKRPYKQEVAGSIPAPPIAQPSATVPVMRSARSNASPSIDPFACVTPPGSTRQEARHHRWRRKPPLGCASVLSLEAAVPRCVVADAPRNTVGTQARARAREN